MPGLAAALRRVAWTVAGLLAVVVGGLGIIVPGLPTTVFFIVAAWCFSRSSERLERWVLELPRIGPLVSDYRDGLGMPRRAKKLAVATIVIVSAASALFGLEHLLFKLAVVVAAGIGVWWILERVPTREDVLGT
jgi:uncharacterized membrane protein YbaN (DUF454 family)